MRNSTRVLLVLSYDLLEDRRIEVVIICIFFFALYYIKQIDSMLPCICSVTDYRGRHNVVRTSVTHLPSGLRATNLLFLPHFDVICDLLLNRRYNIGYSRVQASAVLKSFGLFVRKAANF